ncbi:MAG: UDP-N-acetylmuramoyl-L-alanine--D-glutamate ligase [Chitinispirillaceae bacterium]|nr:UDP-N-acetylmuramoyl-L-alanine--D-glutamate ligase [Chitinispirillaceae bacterium]
MSNYFDLQTIFPKRVAVLGAARSGIDVARYFLSHRVEVFISDRCDPEKLNKIIAENAFVNVTFEAGAHTEAILDADLIILSPGIPSGMPLLQKAKARNIPVWSEMELGFRASRATFLAVTGSTGKSTTVSLAGAALSAAGIEHVVAGNIGLPVIGSTPSVSEKGFAVVEVSSFHLETIDRFRPKAAAVLNLMKNHLDRYPSEEAYYRAKMEIARNLTHDDYLILNANDRRLFSWGKTMAGRMRVIYFGADIAGSDSFWCEETLLRYRFNGQRGIIGDCAKMKLRGDHNHDNASVAAALAKIAGADDIAVFRGLCLFVGLPHRLELVAESGGIAWYNDSKSTTAESIGCAVRAFPGGVHLIAGGKDKGCDFSAVREAISGGVRDIVLIGEAAARIEAQWSGLAPIIRAATLAEAVAASASRALPGDTVVFSPGCSSFDMFRDFEDRGDQFRSIVLNAVGRAQEALK